MTALVSCCLSAAGIRFLGILSRPGLVPLLRSAYRAAAGGANPSGVSMFRTRETRLGPGALSAPGTAVPSRPGPIPDRRLPPHSGRSLSPPVQRTVPGSLSHEASSRVHCRSPLPAFPSPVVPGRNGDPRAFP